MATATLGDLKTQIADDLDRSDLSTQIADAINNAIAFYASERFYFNEARTLTFNTVANQDTYTVSDNATIPLLFDIDAIFVTVGDAERPVEQDDPTDIEYFNGTGQSTGAPLSYAWFAESLRFSPIPDDAYQVRVTGAFQVPAPTADDDSTNKWITEAFELIRCRAKAYLYSHVIRDPDGVVLMVGEDGMHGAAGVAFDQLKAKTSKKVSTGWVRPTTW